MPSRAEVRKRKKKVAQQRRAIATGCASGNVFKQSANPSPIAVRSQPKEPRILAEDTLKLTDYGLPEKLANSLYWAGMKTVRDLVGKTSSEILEVKQVGPARLEQITSVLRSQGLTLRA